MKWFPCSASLSSLQKPNCFWFREMWAQHTGWSPRHTFAQRATAHTPTPSEALAPVTTVLTSRWLLRIANGSDSLCDGQCLEEAEELVSRRGLCWVRAAPRGPSIWLQGLLGDRHLLQTLLLEEAHTLSRSQVSSESQPLPALACDLSIPRIDIKQAHGSPLPPAAVTGPGSGHPAPQFASLSQNPHSCPPLLPSRELCFPSEGAVLPSGLVWAQSTADLTPPLGHLLWFSQVAPWTFWCQLPWSLVFSWTLDWGLTRSRI